MNQHLSQDFIEKVREAIDIVAVISDHLTVKKAGTNYKALCPFHLEKTPSFSINPKLQIFKCFGCGKAGNVFHFLMALEGSSFPETVIRLAEQNGIPIPEQEPSQSHTISRKNTEEVLSWSAVFFQRQLVSVSGKTARDYLQSRGISSNTINKFQIGFAPNQWEALLQEATKEGFTTEVLEQAGLIIASKKKKGFYDRFRNRLMFPIWNAQGKVIAFGGRVLSSEDQPKYLNSPETNVFSKKRTLYAFHFARPEISPQKNLLVMEGYTDVLMAHQYGFSTATATLGTSLTPDHARFVKRYAEAVTLVFDGDSAGIKAAFRSLNHFISQGIMIRIAVLPEKQDPCDFLSSNGADAFAMLVENAEDFFDFQIRQFQNKYDMSSTSTRRSAIREINQIVAQIPDPITKNLFTNKIADTFKIPKSILIQELRGKTKAPVPVTNVEQCRNRLHEIEERFVLSVALHYPERREEIFSRYSLDIFVNENLIRLAKYIAEELLDKTNVDVAGIANDMEPELGRELISLYYNPEVEDPLKVEKKLELILKGANRKSKKAKLAKYKEMLLRSSDDGFNKKILMDAHQTHKNHLK